MLFWIAHVRFGLEHAMALFYFGDSYFLFFSSFQFMFLDFVCWKIMTKYFIVT